VKAFLIMLLSHALSQHSVTSTNKFLLRVRPAPLRVPAPPSKCRYLQPARVNPPGAGLLCLLRKRMEAERWRLLFPETTDNLVFQAAYNERYFVIQVTCNMNTEGQTCNENSGHWQGPVERAQVNKLNQWSGRWHKYTKKESSHFTI